MPKKRNDGRYELKVRISKPGEPRCYKAVYGSTLREAQEKKRKLEAEIAAGLDAETNPTVAQTIDYWLALKAGSLRPESMQNYTVALNHVRAKIGAARLKALTVEDARRLHDALMKERSAIVANRACQRMKSLCDDAVIRGVIPRNPFDYVALKKTTTKGRRALTEAELAAFDAAALLPIDRLFISLMRYAGLRRGEATALTIEDVNFDRQTITINKSQHDGLVGPPKTKAGDRTVPLPEPLADIIKNYIDRYHPTGEGLLIRNERGGHWKDSTITSHWQGILRAAFKDNPPADVTTHIFRHTYTSDLVKNHVPVTAAKLVLGHDDYNTTLKIYTHFGYSDIDSDQIRGLFKPSEERSSKSSSNNEKSTQKRASSSN